MQAAARSKKGISEIKGMSAGDHTQFTGKGNVEQWQESGDCKCSRLIN